MDGFTARTHGIFKALWTVMRFRNKGNYSGAILLLKQIHEAVGSMVLTLETERNETN